MKYHKGFYFPGADEETEVVSLASTEEEPKSVGSMVLTGFEDTNGSIVSIKVEREYIVEDIRTKDMLKQIPHIIEIGVKLPVGQKLSIFAQNITSGQNSFVQGYIVYEITA